MSVTEVLDRLEVQRERFANASAANDEGRTDTIIALRQDFSAECGNLLKAMCDDPRIFGNREAFTQMQEELDQIRSRMSFHQLKWQGDKIEQNAADYRTASSALNALVESFIAKVRASAAG